MIYLLDSDILNYLLRGREPVASHFIRLADAGVRFVHSVVVHYEVTRYLQLKQSYHLLRLYHRFVSGWSLIDLDAKDWMSATDLWVKRHAAGQPIQDADLLIAATALKSEAILVTNNTRHFSGLGLTLENWTAD